MKILLVHEYYRSDSPSGEDAMFRAERELLVRAGHDVVTHEVHNDSIGASFGARLRTAAAATWSAATYRQLEALVAAERPAIAHFHNTFPLISPSGYRVCRAAGVPVVQTLHNYRLVCPNGLLQRSGAPCEACVGRLPWRAVRHACYRASRPASAAAATMLATHRALGTYGRDVDRYLALTGFARDVYVRGGLPAERIVVRPNGLPDDPGVGDGRGGFALFAGRLSAEKGVRTLVRAWQDVAAVPLVVAGDGPLRAELEATARASGARIRFVGRLAREAVLAQLRDAALFVLPSEWYEGLPVTLLEAYASGTPVVAARIGALATLVEDGRNGALFNAGDPAALAAAVESLLADGAQLRRVRAANRALFEHRYSPPATLRSLEAVYEDVVGPDRSPRGVGA